MWEHSKRDTVYEKISHQELNRLAPWCWTFQPPELGERTFWCLSHPACGISLWQLKLNNIPSHSVLTQRPFNRPQGPNYIIWPLVTHLNLSPSSTLLWPFSCFGTFALGFYLYQTLFPQISLCCVPLPASSLCSHILSDIVTYHLLKNSKPL